jgi:hypothetical protein
LLEVDVTVAVSILNAWLRVVRARIVVVGEVVDLHLLLYAVLLDALLFSLRVVLPLAADVLPEPRDHWSEIAFQNKY